MSQQSMTVKQRLAPFLALLDARFAPLLFAALPQAHVVYKWLWVTSDRTDDSWFFAIMGALGFEAIYVGAIAWAEAKDKMQTAWFWLTAGAALVFSIAVSFCVYAPRESVWIAWVHAGLPVVAFCYTMLIHNASNAGKVVAAPAPEVIAPAMQKSAPSPRKQISKPAHNANSISTANAPIQLAEAGKLTRQQIAKKAADARWLKQKQPAAQQEESA